MTNDVANAKLEADKGLGRTVFLVTFMSVLIGFFAAGVMHRNNFTEIACEETHIPVITNNSKTAQYCAPADQVIEGVKL